MHHGAVAGRVSRVRERLSRLGDSARPAPQLVANANKRIGVVLTLKGKAVARDPLLYVLEVHLHFI